MSNSRPWDFGEAADALRRSSTLQEQAADALREAIFKAADSERAYREALSKRIVQLQAEGVAWTVTETLARGEKPVADLRYARDVAAGMVEVAQQVMWRRVADRKDAQRLADWSCRRELAEAAGVTEPNWSEAAA